MNLRYLYSLLVTLHIGLAMPAVAQDNPTWSVSLDSVMVRGKRFSSPIKQKVDGSIVWNLQMMDDMPKIMGNADPVHYTQMLPGIQTNNEFKSQVNIQGSDHSHSQVSVFGVPVYNVSHLLGFFSVFNGSHYPSMTITKNPMSASFPNKLGGELFFDLSDSVPLKASGEAAVGLISSQGTIRLPLSRKVSLNISLRGSYINALYSQWLKTDDETIRYSFYDTNATLLYRIDHRNSILLDFYHGNDRVSYFSERYLSDMEDTWGNTLGAVHWLHKGYNGFISKSTLYVTSYRNKFDISMQRLQLRVPSSITDVGLKSSATWNRWNGGLDVVRHQINPQKIEARESPYVYPDVASCHSLESSIYCNYTLPVSKSISLSGGVRGTLYHVDGWTSGSVDPNIALIYESYNTQIALSYALRHQYLFQTGFSNIGLPTEYWQTSNAQRRPQYGHLWGLNFSQYLFRHHYKLTADVFYKKLYHQTEHNGSVLDYLNSSTDVDNHLLFGKGENYGFSVMLNKCAGRLTGWVSYSYTRAKRWFDALGQGSFPANHERPHEVNMVATYAPNKHWSFGAVFVYASGTPFTAPAYVGVLNKNIMIEYNEHNSNRLKPYMRLDLSVNYKWKTRLLKENGINLSLYNATSKSNELFYYIESNHEGAFAYSPVELVLNILPSISYFCKF